MKRNIGLIIILTLIIQSCSLLGVHYNVHNPKKPGKYPKFSKEQVLLGELTELRTCYDVHYYDFSLDVDHKKKKLDGVVQIHATAITDFDRLQIDLHPNFEITNLIDKNTGKSLDYERSERAVYVRLNQKKDEKFIIEIAYNGKPPVAKKPPWKGGFVWGKDEEKNPWLGVACESDGASLWWPLKDHTSDEADSVRLHYTVPKGLTAVGNGQFEGEEEKAERTTFNWFVSYPINSYNITIYVGKFKKIEETYTGINDEQLAISHFVLVPNAEKAKRHFRQLHDILKAFEEVFGEYPWYRDGFKLVESPYAGMEHQTAIAYGNGYKNDADDDTDYIILHETAHEWWGNSITVKDLADVWIQEGFATYAEALYFEKASGKRGYEDQLFWSRIFIKNKFPVVAVKDRRCFHFRRNSDVYGKGAWILHSLRDQIDDDSLFFDIIQTFYSTYKYQIVETADFINMVNAKTEKDYAWFFDHYLHNNEAPELEYAISPEGTLYYRWTNVKPNFTQLNVRIKAFKKVYSFTPRPQLQKFKLPVKSGRWSFKFLNNALFVLTKNEKMFKN